MKQNMIEKTALVLVLYNELPSDLIIEGHKMPIIIIDNTPNRNLKLDGEGIIYIPLLANKGIAYALNVAAHKAIELQMDWILTMDQDSILSVDMLENYSDFLLLDKRNIGVISPIINMYKGENKQKSVGYKEIDEAITSGSLINLNAYKEVGGFKDEMFIDAVDFEFCWNLKAHGYKIYQVNNVVMQHQLGHTQEIVFWGKHLFYVTHHNYIRHYYMQRNGLYMRRIYASKFSKLKSSLKYYLWPIFKILFFEKDKLRKLKARYQGYCDFKNNNMGEYIKR